MLLSIHYLLTAVNSSVDIFFIFVKLFIEHLLQPWSHPTPTLRTRSQLQLIPNTVTNFAWFGFLCINGINHCAAIPLYLVSMTFSETHVMCGFNSIFIAP